MKTKENAVDKSGLRVLVVAHGHPEFSKGGGEVAAYNLYKGLKDHPEVEACWYLGAKPSEATGGISYFDEGEYIWRQGIRNAFLMKSLIPQSTLKDWPALLETLQPNVIHFHHFVHLGLEAIKIARKVCPNAKIILTLHEMLAICLSDGQMVKKKDFALCNKSSYYACNQCFPEYSPEDFWLRKRYYLNYFEHIDKFITPSHFLKDRYVDWGISENHIEVIENGLPVLGPVSHRLLANGEIRNRIGFFGQITLYKGVDLLLEALHLLPGRIKRKLCVEIHGANLEVQKPEFQERVRNLLAPLVKSGVIRLMGAYSREDLYKRMIGVDWLIIPSIWWENSPVVIQEAFSLKKPVIAADIGGMAEKVQDNVDGIHFVARNSNSLSSILLKIAEGEIDWDALSKRIVSSSNLGSCVDSNVRAYGI